jgi:hypothetical protein
MFVLMAIVVWRMADKTSKYEYQIQGLRKQNDSLRKELAEAQRKPTSDDNPPGK